MPSLWGVPGGSSVKCVHVTMNMCLRMCMSACVCVCVHVSECPCEGVRTGV